LTTLQLPDAHVARMRRPMRGPVESLEAARGDSTGDSAAAQEEEADRSTGQQASADEQPLGLTIEHGGSGHSLPLANQGGRVERGKTDDYQDSQRRAEERPSGVHDELRDREVEFTR
jgi:hypothetical protein